MKEIGEISVPHLLTEIRRRERVLTPDTIILGKVGFIISLLCSRNRGIVGVAR